MEDTGNSKGSYQQTRKVNAKELVQQINNPRGSFGEEEDDDFDCNVGEEFDRTEENPRRHMIRTPQTRMHRNNLSLKNNAQIDPDPKEEEKDDEENDEKDFEERPQGECESHMYTATFNHHPADPKLNRQKSPAKLLDLDHADIAVPKHIIQHESSKVSQKDQSRSRSQIPRHSKADSSSKSRYDEYDKILNNGLSNAVDISLSAAKEEYFKNSENVVKGELHKVRLKNAELRLAIENAKKEKENLGKDIEKIRLNIARSEKSREADASYMKRQDEELTKIKTQIKKQQQTVKAKAQELQKLQKQLSMANSVKMKYEAIIKKVLENSDALEVVKGMFGNSSEMEFINLIIKDS